MLQDLAFNIWTVLLDTAFWLLLGLLAAGWIKLFIPESAMRRWVGGHGIGAVSRAALFGAPLPLCSCGVLPAAIGLHRAGASKEATVSFLISTPETSVDSVAVTWALMGPVMAVYRPLAALVSAMVTGMLTALVRDPALASNEPVAACCDSKASATNPGGCCEPEPVDACCEAVPTTSCCEDSEQASVKAGTKASAEAPPARWLQALRYAGAELLDDISLWLAIGIVIAGIMLTFIPPDWLAQWGGGLSAMLIMLLVGIPMYICAVASTPVAAGLLLAGVSPGAVLVFLLVGPATNVTSFALVRRELGIAVTAVYLGGIAVVSLAMGLLLEWLIASYDLVIEARIGHAHAMLPDWLSIGSAVLLLVLALKPLRRKLMPWLEHSARG